MTTRMFILIAALLAWVQPAQANEVKPQRLEFEEYYTPEARNYLAPSMIPLNFTGNFQVWYLLGEPVVNCTAQWLNPHQLSAKSPGGDTIIVQNGEAEAYNLKLVAQAAQPDAAAQPMGRRGGHVAAFCDAGIVAQNGNDGFNVAGSPNWDKFLCRLTTRFQSVETASVRFDREEDDECLSIGGNWYSADEARRLMRAGLKFDMARVKSVEVNVGDAIRRHEREQWRERSFSHRVSRAEALGERLRRANGGDGSIAGALSATNLAGQMRGRKGGEPPTRALIEEFDQNLQALEATLEDRGGFAAEWRENEKVLVGGQLARVRAIEPSLLAMDDQQEAYRNQLKELAEDAPKPDPLDRLRGRDLKIERYWFGCALTRRSDGEFIDRGRTEYCGAAEAGFGLYYLAYPYYKNCDFKIYDNAGNIIKDGRIPTLCSRQSSENHLKPFVDESGSIIIKFSIGGYEINFPYD